MAGLRLPGGGLVYYEVAEFQSDVGGVTSMLQPNATVMIDITLNRNVDARVFRFTENLPTGDQGEEISGVPLGQNVP